MPKQRKWSDDDLINAVKISYSLSGVLRTIGLSTTGSGSAKLVLGHIRRLGLDISHFDNREKRICGNRNHFYKGQDGLYAILVKNSKYANTTYLKHRLLKQGILKNQCYECGQLPYWNGRLLVMVLDHINGINNDHRIENLRLLCPNCNSQQNTFAGKNKAS